MSERIVSDSCDGIRNCDAGKAAAPIERIVADNCDGVGDGDASDGVANSERVFSDSGDGIGRAAIGHCGGDSDRA